MIKSSEAAFGPNWRFTVFAMRGFLGSSRSSSTGMSWFRTTTRLPSRVISSISTTEASAGVSAFARAIIPFLSAKVHLGSGGDLLERHIEAPELRLLRGLLLERHELLGLEALEHLASRTDLLVDRVDPGGVRR